MKTSYLTNRNLVKNDLLIYNKHITSICENNAYCNDTNQCNDLTFLKAKLITILKLLYNKQ